MGMGVFNRVALGLKSVLSNHIVFGVNRVTALGLKSVVSNHTAFEVNRVIAITTKSALSNHIGVNPKSITMAQRYLREISVANTNQTGVNPKSITMAQRYRYEISMANSGGCIHPKSISMAMAKAGGYIGGRGYITMAQSKGGLHIIYDLIVIKRMYAEEASQKKVSE
ncbi:hypothetical protein KY290_011974 [Solanum tuberosum]|uniref:Uncharacterized protein n=1 Tax=Solanum tuberosum TaxID=4113 RepID=A0ABQ7W281_SOLTU|nr:hypothetical protein KY289_013019 [Solanum tuberosum]KAH0710635.1 hypothetical protein KY284_012062 [Solanum tuberosum]KAH0736306.1 hypothetical protein KY285_012013 [Solanum tuberosum]KAH0774837.1 hypothetical protein KY290_011974 [Solanum tuberosum]